MLYAKWQLETYIITFDANNSVINPNQSTREYTFNDDITLPSISRTGYYDFKWEVTTASGKWVKNQTFDSGYTIQSGIYFGDVTFTAQSTPKEYTITFDANQITYPAMKRAPEMGTERLVSPCATSIS